MLTIDERPTTFSQVVGQERTLAILKAVLSAKRIPSTFLFTGCWGSGKTSCARILAARVNCEEPQNKDACGKCNSCVTIHKGTSDALVEIDSAVYGSADNVRTLTEMVDLAIPANYRVVVLDEAHSLSKTAFNALLKVMEEAPENVIFVLVTTEMEKVPATVQSRAVSFHFGPIPENQIVTRLTSIAEKYNIPFEVEGLQLVARMSPSLRDAIKNLEVIGVSMGEVSKENASHLLGDAEMVREVLRKVLNNIEADDELDHMFESCPPLLMTEETITVLTNLLQTDKISTQAYAQALDIVWSLTSIQVFDSRSKLVTRLAMRRMAALFGGKK